MYWKHKIKQRKKAEARYEAGLESMRRLEADLKSKGIEFNNSNNITPKIKEEADKGYVPDRSKKDNKDFIGTDGGSYTIRDNRVIDKSNGKTTFKNVF